VFLKKRRYGNINSTVKQRGVMVRHNFAIRFPTADFNPGNPHADRDADCLDDGIDGRPPKKDAQW